jgi:uncharacterized membrane protein YphA (DoxX/SURF4 family)
MIKHIARILLGLIFIFSGFVKGIDPWGSAYKFSDYFTAFHWSWLGPLAFSLGVLLAAAEFAIGVALVFRFFIRISSWFALVFMVFFTGLTLYIAIKNPVTDCGCFGDAIKLTNWQTFYKNLFFIALALIVWIKRKSFDSKNGHLLPSILSGITMIVYAYLVVYSYNHLPIIDFRPYKVGVNIPEAMTVPADAPKPVYENVFYYKNKQTGEEKRFTEKNYPWQDTLHWEFVKMDEPKLIKEGYEPPIHDFRIETREGEDIKDFFLYDENNTFIVIAYDLYKTNKAAFEKINKLAGYAQQNNMNFIGLTASLPDKIDEFVAETGTQFEFFNTDEITLKTIIRSNPGLIVLRKGTILKKWHFNDIPAPEKLQEELDY